MAFRACVLDERSVQVETNVVIDCFSGGLQDNEWIVKRRLNSVSSDFEGGAHELEDQVEAGLDSNDRLDNDGTFQTKAVQ